MHLHVRCINNRAGKSLEVLPLRTQGNSAPIRCVSGVPKQVGNCLFIYCSFILFIYLFIYFFVCLFIYLCTTGGDTLISALRCTR